jgi:kinesin family protein 6/9
LQSEVVQEQLKRMQLQVAQRDNEINILVGMLKKKGAKMTVSEACTQTDGGSSLTASASTSFLSSLPASTPSGSHAAGPSSKLHGSASSSALTQSSASSAPVRQSSELPPSQAPLMVLNDPNLLADRNRYFEHFRKSYRKNEVIEENKLLLKERYDEAQTVGKTVNDSRAKINALKAQIEQLRVERAMQGLDQNGQISEEERQMVTAMESEKQRYKENYNRLRDLKSEIEGIQRMLEKSKVQLQKDFEQWYLVMLQQQGLQINKENQNASMTSSASTALSTGTTAPSTNYSSVNASTSSVATSAAVDGKVKYAWGVSTGDAEADADIAAFYAAKESILQQRLQPGAPR